LKELTSKEERLAQLLSSLEQSGDARHDDAERLAYDLGRKISNELQSLGAGELRDFRCRASGCSMNIPFSDGIADARVREMIFGPGAALEQWPGPKIVSPALKKSGVDFIAILLLRAD
jgi:hypothetical protein